MSNHDMSQRKIFVVLGMARSGTSAIARGLNAIGIDLGEHLKAGDDTWNAKGFFEDNEIVYKINRGVLSAIDYTFSTLHLTETDYQQNKTVEIIKKSAKKLLQMRMQDTNQWGFKDPRTANILPFWQSIFRELHLDEHYIIALRNPLSSAKSYQHVTGTDVEFSLLLWMMHLIAAVDGTQNKKRIVVSYESVLQNPREELERMQTYFQLPKTSSVGFDAYVSDFIDKKMRRFTHNQEMLLDAAKVLPLCSKIYELLLQVSHDQLSFSDANFVTKWMQIKEDLAQQLPVYHYINELYQAKKNLQRQMKTMQKSVPWKLIFPLRCIDDALRMMRKKSRKQKKLAQHV